MTLNDVTTLYRKAFTGSLLSPESRAHMWARMPNTLQQLKDTASLEAAWTHGVLFNNLPQAFRDNLRVATKAGG